MDAWLDCQIDVNISDPILTKFEDSFVVVPKDFNKLPDHEQYLAILESKLRKIKTNPNILNQLSAKKEFYMRQLLSEEKTCVVETLSSEIPIADSPILRTILPQRQALNQGELLEFIKYDELSAEVKEDSTLKRNEETAVEKA